MKSVMAAAEILHQTIDNDRPLDADSTRHFSSEQENLPEIRETAYGACRYYTYLDALLSGLLRKPIRPKDRLIHCLLVCALYQLIFMRIPDHAVVNNSVSSLASGNFSWAKNLLNGVLRNFNRNRDKILADMPDDGPIGHAFPKHLYEQILSDWPEHGERILSASNVKPPLTLRVYIRRNSREEYSRLLEDAGMGFELTRDSALGVTLDQPVPVDRIPGFLEGRVSVQDESAQLVLSALEIKEGNRILDGCAAPGGKTGLILESVTDAEEIVAVDTANRAPMISENLQRLGFDATVLKGDLIDPDSWWNGRQFDRILLDVPCSGSGVVRRHPDIKHRRKPGDVPRFHQQQIKLLESSWNMLKPGGKLLYCTCSIFREENDEVVDEFIHRHRNFELQSLPSVYGIETNYGRQRLPGVHSGDGFYYCLIARV